LDRRIHIVKKNTEALFVAIMDTWLGVSADETKYMVMSQDQNVGQNSNIWDFKVVDGGGACTGFICLMIGTGGRLLSMQ
jgi:hypothetical protein